ncbi:alpha/beta fold hydrolase [Lacisediminihabitans sp.]|uniref:alpha/beta fold hydrolase n=1 Tax=Lacisediminihabitans sp. TaxID=2787631 RepID=UPI00374D0D91
MLTPEPPPIRFVASPDGLALASYEFGAAEHPAVIAVHGFASSALLNWFSSGWVRYLLRAGFRVVLLDQRGHGASDKPHDPERYTMQALVADVVAVLDAYEIDRAHYVGYSLGARVGWHAALQLPERIDRAVLGGIPSGDPLTNFRLDEARAFVADRTEIADRLTRTYLTMAESIPGNDLAALIALVEGMRGGQQPDPAHPPAQPILFATGVEDRIIDGSRSLAAAAPHGSFFEIPGRHHFNAPTSRAFRDAAVGYLTGQGA